MKRSTCTTNHKKYSQSYRKKENEKIKVQNAKSKNKCK